MLKAVDFGQAAKTKYPEPITIAIATDPSGKPNPITLGWSMFASGKPPMFAIAVATPHYSVEAIRHANAFTVVWPSSDMEKEAMFFGSRSGRDTNKIKELGTNTLPAEKIDSVLLPDAVANFECVLDSDVQVGDHIIFFGTVVASYMNDEPKKRLYSIGSGHKLGPAAG